MNGISNVQSFIEPSGVPSHMGCGSDGWCFVWKKFVTRMVGIIVMLIKFNLLKDAVLGIFNEAEDAAQLFTFVVTQRSILIKAMRIIRREDFIIGLQLKDSPANNREALFAESTQFKKLETVAILNYFVGGILSLVNSQQHFPCHNQVFFWT